MSDKALAVVILAAGMGSRMRSKTPKVLHKIAGLPMISHVIKTAEKIGAEKIITVIGPDMQAVEECAAPHPCVVQEDRNGTGGAVKCALPELEGFEGSVLVLYADVPMIDERTLREFVLYQQKCKFGATILSMVPPDPTGYGRIFENPDGTLRRIIEHADATIEERRVRIVNSGIMVIDGTGLHDWIGQIKNDNAQGEYYLTDLPEIIQLSEGICGTYSGHYEDLRGVNDRVQLSMMEECAQTLLRKSVMDQGVTMIDPSSVFLSWDTKIGRDVVIEPNVVIGPGVEIAEDVTIKAFSHIEGASISAGSKIGPFARIRPKSYVGENCEIGNFTEVNRSDIGAGTKVKHVSYLGDTKVGQNCNIAAGTVVANYDGYEKHQTILADGVKTGCNSTLVAPMKIAEGGMIAAGSTIDQDVSKDALAIAREKVLIKENWAALYREKKSKKEKAS